MQMAGQASGALTNALNQPYSNMPVQPVAGFSGDQTDAFQNVRNLQGMTNPYFQAAQGFVNQGASPVSADQVSQYFNPYFNQQLSALNDTLGSQNRDFRSNLIQSAGGVGADRIGVGEAEKFRQDQLARGQLAGNTYQQALGAAQQDKQRQEAAGALTASFGPAALGANLQESGSLYNMGSQQQQLAQAQLNAPYQWGVGQFNYPAMLAQLGAGTTGSLAGALGGTKEGTTTYPAQSPWGQVAGLGMMGLGALGGSGGSFFGGKGSGSGGGSPAGLPTQAHFGGRMLADGGPSNAPMFGDSFWDSMDKYPGSGGTSGGIPGVGGSTAGGGKGGGMGSMGTYLNAGKGLYNIFGGSTGLEGIGTGMMSGMSDLGSSMMSGLEGLGTGAADLFGSMGEGIGSLFADGGLFSGLGEGFMSLFGSGAGEAIGEAAPALFALVKDGGRINNPYASSHRNYRRHYADGGDVDEYGSPIIDATDLTLNEDSLGLGKKWESLNPALKADAGYTPEGPGGDSIPSMAAPTQARIPIPRDEYLGTGEMPALPSIPQMEKRGFPSNNPLSNFLMHAGASMAGAGGRDAHGLPLGGGPLGQFAQAAGKGMEGGLGAMDKARQQDMQERRVELEAQRLLESAKMARLPYTAQTANQRAEQALRREQFNRPYEEMTAAQRDASERARAHDALARDQFERPYQELTKSQQATVDNQVKQREMEEKKFELEALKPFKIGVDPDTFADVMGVRDPKTGQIHVINPATGKLVVPGEKVENVDEGGEKKIAGMTQDGLKAAAERYRKTGMLPPNTGRGLQGRAQKTAIENEAARLDKEAGLDPADAPKRHQQFKAEQTAIQRFMSGKQGDTARSLGVVVDHLGVAQKLGDALENGDVRAVNQIATEWAKQTGNPAPTNFDAVKSIVGTEVIKALGVAGAGTEKERAEAAAAFSRASSPAQLKGAIESVQKLLVGQINGLERQFTTSTGLPKEKFRELLPPEALKFYGVGEKSGDDNKAARDWLAKNPNDPRAPAVRKKLGIE